MYEFIFILFSIANGSFLAGFIGFLFWYYIPGHKENFNNDIRWHVLCISISYFLLIACTLLTSINEFYRWSDYWYWIVLPAYILGDISLFFVFRHVIRRDGKKRMENKNKKH